MNRIISISAFLHPSQPNQKHLPGNFTEAKIKAAMTSADADVVVATADADQPEDQPHQPDTSSQDPATDANSVSRDSEDEDSDANSSSGNEEQHAATNTTAGNSKFYSTEEEEGDDEVVSPTSVIPDGDSNADLHALLAFSKKRLDEVKPVLTEDEPEQEEAETETKETTADDGDKGSEEEKKEEEEEVESKDAYAEEEAPTQDVSTDQSRPDAEADEEKPSDVVGGASETPAAQVEGMSSSEAIAMANKPGRDSNKELWALLSYSKQRLETGAHAGEKEEKKKKSSKPRRKKRASSPGGRSTGSAGPKSKPSSATSTPTRRSRGPSDAAAQDMEELDLQDGEEIKVTVDDDAGSEELADADSGNHQKEDAVNELGEEEECGSEYDSLEEEEEEEEEGSSEEEDDSEEESSDEESDDGLTPSFLRQLEEKELEDGREAADAAADAKIMSDAARHYADAILSVASEKSPGNLTDEQMLEAMYVAEAAAAAGEERFTTFGSLHRLHEAKASIQDLTASMKAEMEKAAEKAKAAKDRQVARQSKLFSGERPTGKWFKGQLKAFQDTCAKVDKTQHS